MTETEHWGLGVKSRREAALISQRELADASGVSQSAISRIELRGTPVPGSVRAALRVALNDAELTLENRKKQLARKALAKLSQLDVKVLGLEQLAESLQ